MKRLQIFALILLLMGPGALAQDDYYINLLRRYQNEAAYYQKKADDYRRDAAYLLKKAESYQRDAANYTKRGQLDRATTSSRHAQEAMSGYKSKLKYATESDVRAAMYLRKAEEPLKNNNVSWSDEIQDKESLNNNQHHLRQSFWSRFPLSSVT